MEHVTGIDRLEVQLLPASIEEYVGEEAPIRFIDAFVSGLNFEELGFTHAVAKTTGRPAYHPATLLKLYLYGYLNRIRSSRRLETETHRNMEMIWLLQGLCPDFKTIANFRKDNRKAFKPLFREFNLLCRELGLFGAELVAIDGSKFKAVSNSRNHHTSKQLQKAIEKIEQRIDTYLEDLKQSDDQVPPPQEEEGPNPLKEKLDRVQQYRDELAKKLKDLEKSELSEIGGHDPEARQMKISKVPSVGYNVQIAVDEKHHLIVAQEVVQDANDEKQLLPMCQACKKMLAPKIPGMVTDTGYHSFEQLEGCEALGITTYVPRPKTSSGRSPNGEKIFTKETFEYDVEADLYRCPANQELKAQRSRIKGGKSIKEYQNRPACRLCEIKEQCTKGKYRSIERFRGQEASERVAERLKKNPDKMAKRKAIVEHVFGTMRMWDHDTFLMRGLEKVKAEFSLTSLTYNLKRAINVIGVPGLLEAMKTS